MLWEIDLTEVGGDRCFCNEQNGERRFYHLAESAVSASPVEGSGGAMNGKGSAARPTLTVSNLHGMVTGMAEDLGTVGGTVVLGKGYARFLDAVNFVNGTATPIRSGSNEPLAHRAVQRTECGQCLLCVVHTDGNGRRCFSGTYHAGQHLHLDLSAIGAVITVRRSRMNMTSQRPIRQG
ncbi:phage minor tail protein L [Escherichia coli]|uniref:phage minor tail protein L n=1 Tax=Escherichia coli TaxID=562 RepID=UPI003D7F825A